MHDTPNITQTYSHYWFFWVIYWSGKKLKCTKSNLVLLQTSPYGEVFDWNYTQGSISFILQGWGGRSSDQHITENSNFLRKIHHDGKVMADRGSNISETLGTYGKQLVIPSFTRGKKQLNPGDVELTRRIASVRIHVERVIGSIKQKYSLLDKTLPIDFLMNKDDSLITLDKIVLICCALVNLCPSVVPF